MKHTLKQALDVLKERGTEAVVEQRGRILFERKDIERCLEFQAALKQRFARDLRLLDPEIDV